MTYRSYHDATTRSSVLQAVTDTTDKAAWERFFDLYAGFVFAVARSKGLSAHDADDIVQTIFIELSNKMKTFTYDSTKGKFRSYLLELINWRVMDKLRSIKNEIAQKATLCNEPTIQASGTSSQIIEREWRTAALNEALRRLQPDVNAEHFAAFVESTIEGLDTTTVMNLHGLTRDNLYQIRKRITAKLEPLIKTVLHEMDHIGGDATS